MTCSVETCDRTVYAKGYCAAHYKRVLAHNGDPLAHRPIGRKNPDVICTCLHCGGVFVRGRNASGRYCSSKCAWLARGGAAYMARVARETAAQRGDKLRGRGNGLRPRKRSGRHEHRGVAEQKLGRRLLPGEVVHHIDGDKFNNAPENLAVMTQSEHIRIHKPCRWATGWTT